MSKMLNKPLSQKNIDAMFNKNIDPRPTIGVCEKIIRDNLSLDKGNKVLENLSQNLTLELNQMFREIYSKHLRGELEGSKNDSCESDERLKY